MYAWHLTSKHCTYIFFFFLQENLHKSKKKNLTIRKFAEQKKKVQTLSSGKTHKFCVKRIAKRDLSLAELYPYFGARLLDWDLG
jgi:hypothetical protein